MLLLSHRIIPICESKKSGGITRGKEKPVDFTPPVFQDH